MIVHSSSHDKRRQKNLNKAITKSAKSVKTALGGLQKLYFCEADALTAAARVEKLSNRLHTPSRPQSVP